MHFFGLDRKAGATVLAPPDALLNKHMAEIFPNSFVLGTISGNRVLPMALRLGVAACKGRPIEVSFG